MSAKNLVVGDASVLSNESTLKVSSISIDDRFETVYNFEVENAHTYFVTEDAVLVHNKCVIKEPDLESRKRVFDMMQSLTDDELQMDANGIVTVNKRSKGQKGMGTQLLRDVIGASKTTEIYTGKGTAPWNPDAVGSASYPILPDIEEFEKSLVGLSKDEKEKRRKDYVNNHEKRLSQGEKYDSRIWLSQTPSQLTLQDQRTGEIYAGTVPIQFTLGHELIHSKNQMNGKRQPSSKTAYVNAFDFQKNIPVLESVELEEALTTGLKNPKIEPKMSQSEKWLAEEKNKLIERYKGPSQNGLMTEAGLNYLRYGYDSPNLPRKKECWIFCP
ncbi:polymorphic toxin-type HINT domain-containing protein [Leptospira stimsonii]|uniref:Uncharacterized protein n=1 Tax=Leptospira stimsonii TaxID=2202203 RepID=A0A396YKM5_9LEPT|nr:polymorphic toxin-type HINT domain-containing protein [Leptospira stimsonii]RHX83641.1 hypothetical protein DLM75_23725 [Leptospira stimsonii]